MLSDPEEMDNVFPFFWETNQKPRKWLCPKNEFVSSKWLCPKNVILEGIRKQNKWTDQETK